MSSQAVAWASDQVAGGQGPKLLLLVLADNAAADGVGFMGRKLMASRCECALATVSEHLSVLESAGFLRRFERKRPNGSRTSSWIVLAPGSQDRGRMVDSVNDDLPGEVLAAARTPVQNLDRPRPENPPGGGAVLPTPLNPREELTSSPTGEDETRADTKKDLTYRGKRVDPLLVVEAHELLERFNAAGERRLQPTNAHLRQIVGAMLARPDVYVTEWLAAIDATFANPPTWIDGRPLQLGDIFGERAAQHALANTGKPTGKAAESAEYEATRRRRQDALRRLQSSTPELEVA